LKAAELRLLLDTHVLLRLLAEPGRVDRQARQLIERSDVFVSIKAALGKLKVRPADVLEVIDPSGFSVLAIQGNHAARVYDLGHHHHDPFDRLLIAQAQLEMMTLLTYDETLVKYGDCVRLM
jgi:PIN domain nuclease of toxin-antitoxin system